MGLGSCFLTPAAKAPHRPIQAGLQGLSGFAAYWSSGFLLFSVPIPKILFFVYTAQFLHKALLPSSALIAFYRTLLEH